MVMYLENGQTSYEAAVNEGRLTIYNGVDSNGSGIALPSSDIPPFSKLIEITDAWAQTIILANNNITIPAGSTMVVLSLLHLLLRMQKFRIHKYKVEERH